MSERPSGFVPDPKPWNFDAIAAAWNDPMRLEAETAKYRRQVAEYHLAIREGRTPPRRPDPDGETPF